MWDLREDAKAPGHQRGEQANQTKERDGVCADTPVEGTGRHVLGTVAGDYVRDFWAIAL